MDGRNQQKLAVPREVRVLAQVKEQRDKEKTVAARSRQRAIGRELRRMYDNVVQEPVPDEFLLLLKEIDAAKKKDS
jgi:hypothetical protein